MSSLERFTSEMFIDPDVKTFLNRIKTSFSDVKGHEFEIRVGKDGKHSISEVFLMLFYKNV